MDTPSILLGVAALAVSGWAVIQARGTAEAQTRLQGRLLALESARERDRLLHARRATRSRDHPFRPRLPACHPESR